MPASDDEDGNSDREQETPPDSPDEKGIAAHIHLKDAILVSFFAAVAVISVMFFPLSIDSIANLDFGALLSPASLLIVLVALPVAYAASISLEGFKKESLFAFIVLPAFAGGGKLAVAAAAVPVSTLYASYKARSLYNGRNERWVLFRSGSAIVLSFAIATGLGLGYTVATDNGFAMDLQNATTNKLVSQATDIAGAGATGLQQQQKEQAMRMAESLGISASTMAIRETEEDVVQRMDNSGSFSNSQQTTVLQAFAAAKTNVPIDVANNLTRTIEGRFNQSQLTGDGINSSVQSAASGLTDPLFQNSKTLAAGVFMASLSFLYILKIPFQLFTLLFGTLLLLIPD